MHIALTLVLLGALPPAGSAGSHQPWLNSVRSAMAREYRNALAQFDARVREHPEDHVAAVERCKLLAGNYANEDDPFDAEAPTHADCVKDLERAFPESTAALAYRMEYKWGAQAVTFGEQILANRRLAFSDLQRAHINERLAQAEKMLGHAEKAEQRARAAMRLDPSIDLTEMLAGILLDQGRKSEAIVELCSRPEGTPYQLQQKARKLADAGAFSRAQWMLDKAAAGKSFEPDPALVGRIAEGTGKLKEAQAAYQKQRGEWNKSAILSRLFQLALAGDDAKAADEAYQHFRDQGFTADPLARQRFALQWRFPRTRWRARDLAGVAALIGCLLGLALLPFLVLLPLHTFVLWRRQQRPPEPASEPYDWWFRHAYLVMGLMLVWQFLALYVFGYDELSALISRQKLPAGTARSLGRFALVYSIVLVLSLALLFAHRPRRLRWLGPGSWSLRKCVGQALISLLLGYAAAGFSSALFRKPATFTIDDVVQSMAGRYGLPITLLSIGVLIPIAEEMIFRSVLLTVLSRHLKFWVANSLQAVLFAALHADPLRLIYYTTFGLLAGRMRRASGGLLASIVFHASANMIAVLLLTSMGSALQNRVPEAKPGGELIACAREAAPDLPKPVTLNNLAWQVALHSKASRDCLIRAEEALDAALRSAPESSGYLDTKATVLFRLGRYDEAIDLERAAAERAAAQHGPQGFYFSQIDRYLRARGGPLFLGGSAGAVRFSVDSEGKNVQVDLPALDEGFVLFARRPDATVLRLAAGPRHRRSYRIPLPASMRTAAPFDLALLDSRGCDDCQPGAWAYLLSPHDTSVDRYP